MIESIVTVGSVEERAPKKKGNEPYCVVKVSGFGPGAQTATFCMFGKAQINTAKMMLERGGNIGGMTKRIECEEFEVKVDGVMKPFNHRCIWIKQGQEIEDAAAAVGIEMVGDNVASKEKVAL